MQMIIHSEHPEPIKTYDPSWCEGFPDDFGEFYHYRVDHIGEEPRFTSKNLPPSPTILDVVHTSEADYRRLYRGSYKQPTYHSVGVRTGAQTNKVLFRNMFLKSIGLNGSFTSESMLHTELSDDPNLYGYTMSNQDTTLTWEQDFRVPTLKRTNDVHELIVGIALRLQADTAQRRSMLRNRLERIHGTTTVHGKDKETGGHGGHRVILLDTVSTINHFD